MSLHDLRLSHFTSEPGLVPRAAAQRRTAYKPAGLWVSVDGPDDWPAWCAAEDFRGVAQQHQYRVTLADDARILYLANYGQMASLAVVDWTAVAAAWQGIVIAPYSWAARWDLVWYYGWDCASGCIWDPAGIASVELVREAVASCG